MPLTKFERKKSKSKRYESGAYLLLRAGLGLIICLQGAMQFAEEPALGVNGSIFQETVFQTFAYAVPAIEVPGGIMLLLGFGTKSAIISMGAILLLPIGCEKLNRNLNFAALQSIYIFLLYWLFRNLSDDQISFDRFLSKN